MHRGLVDLDPFAMAGAATIGVAAVADEGPCKVVRVSVDRDSADLSR